MQEKESDTEQSEFGGKFVVKVLCVEDMQIFFLLFKNSALNFLDFNYHRRRMNFEF